MGEQTEFTGLGNTLFFCRQEDIGTEKEKWHSIEINKVKVRPTIEVPEIFVKWPIEWDGKGFYEFNIMPSQVSSIRKRMQKKERGRRYYHKKLLRHVSKKTLRRYCYYFRKYASYVRKEKQP